MNEYICLPSCTLAELDALNVSVKTPIQEGYTRVRTTDPITPTENIIEATEDFILPSGEMLGRIA